MDIQHIVIASPMHKEIQKIIEEKGLDKDFRYLSDEELTQNDLDWADAFVSFSMKGEFDYQKLKWVHSLGAGVDRFLYKQEWPEGVTLTRTVCSFGQRIAEYCLSYLLKDLQEHDQFHSFKQQKSWQPMTPRLLNEQKVMIYGTGEIGQTTAQILSSFGVEVYGVSLSGKVKEGFKQVMTLDDHYEKLSEMDYIINTLPLTEQTFKLFNEKIFGLLSARGFINVGRGASLDEGALLNAFAKNQLKFAVLDVFAEEPLPVNNQLWEHPNVIITPHISAVTTAREGVECFIETLKNIEESKMLFNKVDVTRGY
ncbi:D-2-hydroxyacid dehydrogenase [Mesobacillus maritimus]|uniref:D-2-hydroxyacid dehydrogenase n=1 Tax=Mesobacillus maritimus TaxID=1643336 RepID=A0ABS7K1L8_9BACI|nr:D-2-hydroxyacid dehydrogenase [Mesobacillus maritimus]